MLHSFAERYLPLFQAPDAPSGAGATTPSSAPSDTSSTPSTTPASTTPSSTEPSPTSTSGDSADSSFDFMFDTTNEDPLEGLGLPTPAKQEPETTPKTPASAQSEKPASATSEKTPAAPDKAPAPTEATSQVPTSAPTLDPYDPGQLAQHLVQNEAQAVQYAADNLFKLSPEEVEALESDVVGTIPKLLGKVLVASQRNFLMQLSQLVPTMIQRQGEVSKAHTQAVGEFYTRWPDIDKVKDTKVAVGDKQVAVGDIVKQYAVVYRQMHPQASRQDAIEAVGPMVMMAAKIVPGAAQAAAPVTRPSPMAPGANGRPPQPTPFVPAGPSAGGASTTTTPQMSAVEAMFASDE